MADDLFQFKVELDGVEPAVWRRILIPADESFFALHAVIQDSMGWEYAHLFMFTLKKTKSRPAMEIGLPSLEFGEVVPCWEVSLGEIFTRKGQKIHYEYDFGDSWGHTITFEGRDKPLEDEFYPLCIEGERACPPEDSGGVLGYMSKLEILQDPKHEMYEDIKEWMGDFDPEAFNEDDIEYVDADELLDTLLGDDDGEEMGLDDIMADPAALMEFVEEFMDQLPLEIRLKGLSLEDRLSGLSKQELWDISKLATQAR